MAKQSPGVRTILGSSFLGVGGANLLLHLWNREVFGIVFGAVFLLAGVFLAITGRRRDREAAAPRD